MTQAWWGDLPTWLTAGGTIGLAFFAILALNSAAKDRKRLQDVATSDRQRADRILIESRDRAESERRRAQASRVAAWPEIRNIKDTAFVAEFTKDRKTDTAWTGVVRNNSVLPIYDVTVEWFMPAQQVSTEQKNLGSIAPESVVAAEQPEALGADGVSVAVGFRDASGVGWRRDQFGLLSEVGDPES